MSPRLDGPRILFYSHNGVGIGHVHRQLTLARAARERHPGAPLLVVTGSHAAGTLAWPEGVEHLKLPAIRMVDRYETWVPRNLPLSMRKVTKLRSGLIREAVRRFAPDLLVADFIPAGPYGELLPALDTLAERGGRAVAGFRDIVDEPTFVRKLWEKNGTYATLEKRYAAICVYGSPDVVDFEREYGLGSSLASRLHYAGYLAPAPHERGDDPRPFILATAGGGVDGRDLLHRFVDAVQLLGSRKAGRHLAVAGPLLSDRDYKGLRNASRSAGVEIKRTITELSHLIHRADVVVTMAGYNTCCALLSSSARAVLAPRAGPSREQRLRADWLERCGIGKVVPAEVSAENLAGAIEQALAAPPPSPPTVSLDGIAAALDLFERVGA